MPRTIAIVDYGAGNLRSIQKALAQVCGDAAVQVVVTADPAVVEHAAAVVLPGVGAAGATMRYLARQGLVDPVRRAAESGRPFLGICLGLQLLFTHHAEDDVPGLAVLPGRARRLPGGLKIPHMGWNTVQPTAQPILDLELGRYFYFVHSYYVEPAAEIAAAVVGTTQYGLEFCSALVYRQIWATQFHPEKSGPDGLRLLARFVRQVAA
ncbi:MAG TPA: imidazole glycerol phosphate synthase subunit HisH [Chloroflexia bacterium]|nr:imidazole glycerol phosphate synthase subunit HisH [Chloroflexia bacterium]